MSWLPFDIFCGNARGLPPLSDVAECQPVGRCGCIPGGVPPAVVMMDPGEDLDDEMALILLTALESRGLLSLRGVITTLAPSELRARLARGILDELGLSHVPVAAGSDGGSIGKNVAFQRHPCISQQEIVLESDELLLSILEDVDHQSLVLFITCSLKDAASFLMNHEAIFIEKVRSVMIMGGVQGFDPSDSSVLLEPDTAHNNKFDSDASSYFYRRCQEQGVPLVVLTRNAAYACQVPKSIYDELAATGSIIGKHLQTVQQETMERLWRRACAGPDDPERDGLPVRCDKAWFLETFCTAAARSTELTGQDSCWDLVATFNMYDPLAVIGGVPGLMDTFF